MQLNKYRYLFSMKSITNPPLYLSLCLSFTIFDAMHAPRVDYIRVGQKILLKLRFNVHHGYRVERKRGMNIHSCSPNIN